ncbi:hypothetical protein TCDM_12864 [Trypanosoma cruzi Dm28c]|uniref:Uncharacterized protein n=1 Tax=Trypanosoma cruzi Dm28c TaxID=1416333 RepID=V5AK75_TRYCR|nr:hypothetical protein TCDM_12864 [Trypanosoma cruzi Dm28c]
MGTTTASPLEKFPRTVVCVAARRFACSPNDRTAQSFYCGRSVGITRCGVRKSRSPDEDGLVVIWQLRTSGPSPLRIALLARLAQHQPGMALLQDCRHQSASATRLIGCGDFRQACSVCACEGLRRENNSIGDCGSVRNGARARSAALFFVLTVVEPRPPNCCCGVRLSLLDGTVRG